MNKAWYYHPESDCIFIDDEGLDGQGDGMSGELGPCIKGTLEEILSILVQYPHIDPNLTAGIMESITALNQAQRPSSHSPAPHQSDQ